MCAGTTISPAACRKWDFAIPHLPDGRVEMEVQGKAEVVDLLLLRLNSAGRISIEKAEERDCPLCRGDRFEVLG